MVGQSLGGSRLDLSGGVRTLTFLFTDIEGSTHLWEQHAEAMRAALEQHDRILRGAVEAAGGRVVKTTGDGIMAVFSTAADAVAASLASQLSLRHAEWGATGALRVRMGLHVGEAEVEAKGDDVDFHGQPVNRAARIMAAGHGGQALLSETAAALAMDRLPEGASLRDLGEHRLKDLSRPEHVYELVHPGLPESGRPLRTEDDARHALPVEPSTFVGRAEERAMVVAALEDGSTRLLTLTGPGGIGKTRLALRAAQDVEGRYRAGALFVDLSAARDTDAVLEAVSRALGLPDAPEGAQLAELTAAIGRKHLLLILDNFEQVTASAPVLARLLADCPELTLLVTSREALHVRGERLVPVPPLATPEAAPRGTAADRVLQYEAVQLFIDRARAVVPDLAVTDENAPVVAEICVRLEGIPLAIELATARLRVYSLEALRDRLRGRLGVLGTGARDLPERQRTLRATIEWSYQLLPANEQRLLEVLSCFAGATIAAVEDVIAGLAPWLGDLDAIEGLASLVDKSLLRRVDDSAEPRFAMLESVREFASERLEATSEVALAARSAHADHYARWTAAQARGLVGPERADLLERLETEAENLRLAWRCSVEDRDLARLGWLMGGLRPLHDARGWYRGLVDLTDDMLAVLETLPPSAEHSAIATSLRTTYARALAAIDGYTEEVQVAYERLLASLSGAAVPQAFPLLRGLATFYTFRTESEKALELGRRILAMAEEEDDAVMRVAGLVIVGPTSSFGGRLADGLPDLEEAARLAETAPADGDWFSSGPDPRVTGLTALSLLRWWEGRIDTSARRSLQAVALARAGRHPSTIGYALHHASLLRHWRGEAEEARDYAVQAIEFATEHDLHVWRAVGTVILGAATTALGPGSEGLRWIREGLERYRGLRTPPVFWPFMLQVTAEACVHAGDVAFGLAAVDEALRLSPLSPDLHLASGDLLAGSDIDAARGHYEQAWTFAQAWGARMPALRAAIRLSRPPIAREEGAWLDDLREVLDTFTEGHGHPDLVAAGEIVAHRA